MEIVENQFGQIIKDLVVTYGNRTASYLQYFKDSSNVTYADLLKGIVSSTSEAVSTAECLYLFIKGLDDFPTCYCGKRVKFLSFRDGYRRFCSSRCAVNHVSTKLKMEQTNMKRYGHRNPSSSVEVREKVKKTNQERLGVDNPSQSESVKEKKKQTLLRNYNVDNPLRSDIIKNRFCQTNMKRYGHRNPSSSVEVREKVKQTNRERFGVDYYTSTKEFKEQRILTWLRTIGVDAPMKSSKVLDKSLRTRRIKSFNCLIQSDRLKGRCSPNFNVDEFEGLDKEYEWVCTKCNNTFTTRLYHGIVPRCFNCFPRIVPEYYISCPEQDVLKFCRNEVSLSLKTNDRDILEGMEIDVLIPDLSIGIELDGLYWHGELQGKDQFYHLTKTLKAQEKGIQLIHIFEDEWLNKQDIVKSILLSKFNKITTKVAARKCVVKDVDNKVAKQFYFNNHLQGPINGKHIGLIYNNELVSLITLGKPRFTKKYEYEILRFCNKKFIIVNGGLSKLLNYFMKTFDPESIITYADARYGTGGSYNTVGFDIVKLTKPNYFYVTKNGRESRIKYQKHKLSKILGIFDPKLTEWENMQLNGYDRIWDCGNYVYEWRA